MALDNLNPFFHFYKEGEAPRLCTRQKETKTCWKADCYQAGSSWDASGMQLHTGLQPVSEAPRPGAAASARVLSQLIRTESWSRCPGRGSLPAFRRPRAARAAPGSAPARGCRDRAPALRRSPQQAVCTHRHVTALGKCERDGFDKDRISARVRVPQRWQTPQPAPQESDPPQFVIAGMQPAAPRTAARHREDQLPGAR